MPDPKPPTMMKPFVYKGPQQGFPITVDGELRDIQLIPGRLVELPEDGEFIPAWLDLGLLETPPPEGDQVVPADPSPPPGEAPPSPDAPEGDKPKKTKK